MNPNYDGLLSSTIDMYIPKLQDLVFSSKVLLWILTNGKEIKNSHGNKLVVPLLYAESPNVGTYSDDDVFAAPTLADITAAEYDWKQVRGTFRMTGIEEAKNSGKEAILSLVESRMTQLEMTIAETLNTMFYADGTGNDGKDFLGLAALVDDNNTVGGINRVTAGNENWQSYVNSGAVALTEAVMRTAYNSASEGNDQPTNIITTQDGFEKYESLLTPNMRYEDTETADAGFQNLRFKGAPVVFDRACPDGFMYFLNTKYLDIHKVNDVWFNVSDWKEPVNADTKYKNIISYGQFVTTNAKRQGVCTALTDA